MPGFRHFHKGVARIGGQHVVGELAIVVEVGDVVAAAVQMQDRDRFERIDMRRRRHADHRFLVGRHARVANALQDVRTLPILLKEPVPELDDVHRCRIDDGAAQGRA
ncbi:hypothetical protein LP419_25925 [Massilia sp. H-1]|nr:hypothetical protein LP419_25925 [Massilia sp. H-1]